VTNSSVNEIIEHSWLNNRLQSTYQDPARKSGEVKGYYENGSLRFKYPIKNYNLHGEGNTWYENGALECCEEYVEGLRNGTKRQWYCSGMLKSEKRYHHGLLHGLSKEWHENGNFKHQSLYERGRLEGEFRQWYSSGRLKSFEKYANGVKHGYQKYWDLNGKLISEAVYTRGVRIPGEIYELIASNRLNAKTILRIRNSAVRRVCLDELGYSVFLSQTEHEVIEKDGDYELVKIAWNKREEPICLVKVKCHSTGAYYTLRVPPTMQSVKEAIAWTFHMKKDRYNPVKEA